MSLQVEGIESLSHLLSLPVPDMCPLQTLGLFSLIVELARDAGSQALEALDIASQWISLRRTPAEVNDVLSRSCDCSSDLSESKLHVLGAVIFTKRTIRGLAVTHGQALVQACTRVIRDLRDEAKDFPQMKLHHLSSRLSWPSTTKQLLPHGPDETVHGYTDWLAADSVDIQSQVMDAFTMVIAHTWPVAVPAIIKTNAFPRHFIAAASRWPRYLDALMQAGDSVEVAYGVHAQLVYNLIIHLTTVMRILSSDCSDPASAAILFRPHYKEIVVSCDSLMAAVTRIGRHLHISESSAEVVETLISVGVVVYNSFPEERNQFIALPSHRMIVRSAYPMDIPNIDKWDTLAKTLESQHKSQLCSAPSCYRTTEHTGRRLRYCAGCCWVSYCSRRCQKKAWRRVDGLQHRDVCPLLRYICIRHNILPSDKPTISMQIVPILDTKDFQVIEAINRHFAALSTRALA